MSAALVRRGSALLGTLACALFLAAAPAFAATDLGSADPLAGSTSTFEGGDAGLIGLPSATKTAEYPSNVLLRTDWASPGLLINTLADPEGATAPLGGDSSFDGGNKETAPDEWRYIGQPGGVTPSKDNLKAVWAVADGRYLYLSFYRAAPDGNTFLTFELNAAPATVTWTNSAGTEIPCRQDGDVLISYEVTPGGPTDVDVKVYEWMHTGATFDKTVDGVTYHCGRTGDLVPYGGTIDTSKVIAAMNFVGDSDNVLDPDGSGPLTAPATIPAGEFGEAAIDVAAVLEQFGSGCFDFGSFQAHSRSSVAIDSQLQDTLGPAAIYLSSCGVRGVKYHDINGDGAQNAGEPGLDGWRIYVDRNGNDAYDAGEPTTLTHDGGEFQIGGVKPLGEVSTFAVRELAPASDTRDWRCTEPGDRTVLPSDAGCEHMVAFSDGIAGPLSFGNYLAAHVTVDKVLEPAPGDTSDPGLFDLSLSQGATTIASASDQGDGGGIARQEVVPGTYTVLEEAGSVGALSDYDTTIACDGAQPASGPGPYEVTVAAGDDVTCTVTNTRRAARLELVKDLDPDDDSGRFDLAILHAGEIVGDDFAMSGAGEGDWVGGLVAPGSYTVGEQASTGTHMALYATAIECYADGGEGALVAGAGGLTGDERGLDVSVASGDYVVCFATNTRLNPALKITKTGPDHAYDGDAISYEITLTNTGTAPAYDVALSDQFQGTTHGCVSLTGPSGDVAPAGVLEPGEVWKYACSYTVIHADEDSTHHVVDVATATADDVAGGALTPVSASASTLIVHPAIAIAKSGPLGAEPGAVVPYLLTVTNPGDESFAEATVKVTDPNCDAQAVTLVSKNDDASPGSLDPGDTWSYTCAQTAPTGAGPLHNDAFAEGTDQYGKTVNASAGVDVPLVLAEVFGTARLQAPTGCVARTFRARVLGTRIAKVVFYLDGKKVKTLTKPTAKVGLSQVFALRVNPRALSFGVHRVRALVTFQEGTSNKPKTRTFRASFQRCGKKLVSPRFTG